MADSPTKLLRLVSLADPTIDWAAMGGFGGRDEYGRTRDESLLRFLPGTESKTRWYDIVPLSETAWHKYIEVQQRETNKWAFAFLCCVRGIHGWARFGGPFHENEWNPPHTTRVKALDLEIWPEDAWKVVPPAFVQDIGKWCFDRAELQMEQLDFFDLPPGCAAITSLRISRAVSGIRSSAKPETTSEGGESAPTGDATATENSGTSPRPAEQSRTATPKAGRASSQKR